MFIFCLYFVSGFLCVSGDPFWVTNQHDALLVASEQLAADDQVFAFLDDPASTKTIHKKQKQTENRANQNK